MLRFLFLSLLLSMLPLSQQAQTPFPFLKHDYIWLTGYANERDTSYWGGVKIDFNESPPIVTYDHRELDFDFNNATISDAEGNLLFYTNGSEIHNFNHELIENGDSLDTEYSLYHASLVLQGSLILPIQTASQTLYYLITSEEHFFPEQIEGHYYVTQFMRYSVIDMDANGGNGLVLEKNKMLLQDTIDYGKITATRHANGRDWWIIMGEMDRNAYYLFLLTPEGITEFSKQEIGEIVRTGVGQAVFSPDGTKYVKINAISSEVGRFVDIYDFDRCTGVLSNHHKMRFENLAEGISISPNSRYLYVHVINKIFQYDLWADDIEASQIMVAEYDGYESPLGTYFFLGQLAPDNKIYIAAWSSNAVMHLIHNPDKRGLECMLEQHDLHLPRLNNGTIPNNPNFRLGPLDGSPCDTLGFDNYPKAGFDYRIQENEVYFRDISFFNPEERMWNFGDGQTSEEVHPVHTYASAGTYEVCLTVSNENSSDTHCETLNTIITDINDPSVERNYQVFPNPVSDYLNIVFRQPIDQPAKMILTDNLGRIITSYPLLQGFQKFRMAMYKLPAGVYYYQIVSGNITTGYGKLIKK